MTKLSFKVVFYIIPFFLSPLILYWHSRGGCLRPLLVYSLKFYLFIPSLGKKKKQKILPSVLKKSKKQPGHWIRQNPYVTHIYHHDLLLKQINRNYHLPFFKETAQVTLAHSWQLLFCWQVIRDSNRSFVKTSMTSWWPWFAWTNFSRRLQDSIFGYWISLPQHFFFSLNIIIFS